MRKYRAFCPASLSFILKICPDENIIKSGSIGVGTTIDKGVIADCRKSLTTKVLFNEELIDFPTVTTVIKTLTPKPIEVRLKSTFPLGYGFGISAASALGAAWSINQLLSLMKNRLELAKICHIAEVKNKTGLGSVATQITGGFLVKNLPGIPATAKQLPFVGKKIYATIIDKLDTPTMLADSKRLNKINYAGGQTLNKLKKLKSISLSEVFEISYQFAKSSLLLTDIRVATLINQIRKNGGHATVAIFGQVVLSDIKPKLSTNFRFEELTITNKKVHLI